MSMDDPRWMTLQVPTELYAEAVVWLGRRMSGSDPMSTTGTAGTPAPATTHGSTEHAAQYRELLGKQHAATLRVRAFVEAAVAVGAPEWWTSGQFKDLAGLDEHQFRSTWRALTQHMAKFYPDLPKLFLRDSGRALGMGDTAVYRLNPDVADALRAAVS